MHTIQKMMLDLSTPKTDFNDKLREALDAQYWYTGEVANSIFEENEKCEEKLGGIFSASEQLSLEDRRAASAKIWRGTSTVTGNDAFLVRSGNQNTLYADKETVFENHSRVRAPEQVTELDHVGYSTQWAAWALEQEGLTAEQAGLDPSEVGHSPPTGEDAASLQALLSRRGEVKTKAEEEEEGEAEEGKLCEECGEYHTRSFIRSTPHGEWKPGQATCICC